MWSFVLQSDRMVRIYITVMREIVYAVCTFQDETMSSALGDDDV